LDLEAFFISGNDWLMHLMPVPGKSETYNLFCSAKTNYTDP